MAGESIAVAIYKLGMENQQYIAAAKAAAQAGDQLVAANMRVADSEEKAGGASKLRANFVEAELARFDRAQKAQDLYARQIARVAQAEQEGLSTAARRQQLLDQYSSQLNKTITDLERKAKAERDAVQAERDAEAAAKNLARIESEHALALKNVATALGQDRDALIAAANAGNRHASATLDMMNKVVGLNKALQDGKINLAGHAKEIDLVQAAYRNQTTAIATQEAAMRKSSTITGLARHELINLSRQLQDIGVSLAGGQSPFRILIEQGSQIADIFASSRAAFGETFRNLISWVGRAAGSITGIITIVTALGAAAGALALNWLEGQRAIEKALTGIGERAGVSVAQVQKMAEAASANTRLSTNAARESAAEFIKTGKIYGENISVATNLTDKFALAMGLSATEGAKQLADILSDVNKGAMTLDKSFGFLDGRTRELLSTLVAQNRQQEAIALLMQKAAPAIEKAANAASVYAKAWMSVTKAISDSIEMMGRAIVKGAEFDAVPRPTGRARQGSPGRVAAQELRGELPVTAEAADRATKSVEAYEKALNDAATAAADSRFREFGLAADDAVKAIFPQIEQVKVLQKSLEDLKRAQADARISSGAGLAQEYQKAITAVQLQIQLQNESKEAAQRQAKAVMDVANAYNKVAEEEMKVSTETALQLNSLDKQINVLQQRTRRGVEAAVNEQKMNELILQGKSAYEAQLIITRQQQLVHLQNMTTLKEQLNVAEARTGIAKINAQYENDINQRLREGATLSQAIAEATIKRQTAIENVNTAILEQIHSLNQELEMIEARRSGDEAGTKAAQAYENAIRQGADALHAAALEAKVLEVETEKAADAAARAAQQFMKMGQSLLAAGKVSATAGDLTAKLSAVGSTTYNVGSFGVDPNSPLNIMANQFSKLPAALRDIALALVQKEQERVSGGGMAAATQAALDAAKAQQEAAVAAKEAAVQQAEAAKAAREAYISQLDEAVADIVATKLLAGQSAQAVNMLIETGAIQFGTASTRFQTQLDLYKRAGASNAQTAADIRAGIIGEGARPSELLAALDSLTDAVDANTEAQIGLSPFYTSQGDRQLGYRGYTVQRGASNIPGTIGGVVAPPTTGGMIGGMGGVINQPGVPGDPVYSSAPQIYQRIIGSQVVEGYYTPTGQWVTTKVVGAYATSTGSGSRTVSLSGATRATWHAEGGIVDQPTMAIAGEAGPEAFVPLKGGAIPVKLIGNAANQNRPPNVVNINAPLVNFMAEPTRDEVRQSAFQAAQMLRRVAMG